MVCAGDGAAVAKRTNRHDIRVKKCLGRGMDCFLVGMIDLFFRVGGSYFYSHDALRNTREVAYDI